MEIKLNNDLWRHNEVWQINRNHWLEIFRGGFWSHFFFQGGLCPPDFFSAYSTDQNEPLWRKKSAPLKKKKRPSEEKKAPPWKVSPLINLPLLLKNVTGTQCAPCTSLKRVHQLTSLVKMPHRWKSSNVEILHSFHGVYFNWWQVLLMMMKFVLLFGGVRTGQSNSDEFKLLV